MVHALRHPCIEDAGCDGIDANTPSCKLAGERLRERDDSALGRGVARLAWASTKTRHGCDVDDHAVTRAKHSAERGADARHRAVQVGCDHLRVVRIGLEQEELIASMRDS